ncbi:AAA family ATPase [Vibrio aestuarianus]|uniref:AAA family ATPase n=1 Tax=Vibrio aestuarianus TaxID=28171 RepID=A0A9X4J259_9VIBR|nr:AAA family ATPase [Vibrio aestuarianus]MDE1236949.1 AAA family ATPase [Vibrio aestuarianus]MDE1247838.1 AAA family ATPase [Vibrio aestuarianus]MDE1348257.1 AAA family ATPase [Vibrio aestuarianus]NGZ65192.1 ATP-binding protein [Vibrio aestuarianus subsp. cardii]
MIINKVHIEKFRGFADVNFSLGDYVTLIAGQNGTQKSTLLGILSQTFTIPNKEHPFSEEKPLIGGSYRSSFADKFKLSPERDLAGSHEWTLYFHDHDLHEDIGEDGGFTIESIPRAANSIRFWQKGTREAGSGYIQLPVLYLSLKRLIPIAEAGKVQEKDIQLTNEEQRWFTKHYKKVLISRDNLQAIDYLEGPSKNTLGVSTEHYDWQSNSAGQDNLGKILLAILSFKRLKASNPEEYQGGILAIDEIDATLYPGSQVQLLELLASISKKDKIQVIATTHSLQMLEKLSELKKTRGRDKQFNTVYLTKQDNNILVEETPSFEDILHNLNVSLGASEEVKAISIYTEDVECIQFTRAILQGKKFNLKYEPLTMGCNNYLELGRKKVPSFQHPNSIVVLDGDVRDKLPKGPAKLKNFICLPGELNPESLLADFLDELPDAHPFWKQKKNHYSHQVCFRNYDIDEIKANRVTAKKWYQEQVKSGAWGRSANNVYKHYLATIPQHHQAFIKQFTSIYESSFI